MQLQSSMWSAHNSSRKKQLHTYRACCRVQQALYTILGKKSVLLIRLVKASLCVSTSCDSTHYSRKVTSLVKTGLWFPCIVILVLCKVFGSYYSRAVFISLESQHTSMTIE